MNDQDLIQEAKENFRKCREWESSCRARFLEDVRFGNGDSVNLYQYSPQVAQARMRAEKPCLTINRVRQYCLQICNDARQNKAQIEIRPTGGGSSYKSAEILEGIVRHIEYISNAPQAYDCAVWNQVYGGIGWWRVVCDYAHDESFDQEIFIRRIQDPLSVYADPFCKEYDKSDMRFALVYRDMDLKDFEKEYPKHKDISKTSPLGEVVGFDDHQWISKGRIRVCEYYRKVDKADTLHYLPDGSTAKESDMENREARQHLRGYSTAQRDVTTSSIEWYLIAGDEVIEKRDVPGKYIPLVCVLGEELVIEGKLDRRGHVRNLTDAQRMYNYMCSAGAEYVGLQSKTPWIAPVQAIEGYETDWAVANQQNLSILPYNHIDDAGREIPKPEREQPPVYAPAYTEGMKIAQGDMAMASGQFEAVMGEPSNERSGKAIGERQRAGLNATYHFIDHLATALRFTGKIIIDLVPHIYDTERVLKIMAIDGTQKTIKVDPTNPQAHTPTPALDDESIDPQHIAAIFNPNVGDYECIAEVGPAYATKRQEAFNALSDIMAQNESLSPMLMDIWAKNSDFPEADILAQRFQRMLPPQATGMAPPPALQQAQAQLAQQHQLMTQMSQEVTQLKSKQIEGELQKEIDWYKAETDRLKTVGSIDPQALMPVVRQLVSELLGQPINPIIAAHTRENSAMLGIDQGAQQQMDMEQQQQAHVQQMNMQAQQHAQGMVQADQQHAQDMQQADQQHQQQMAQMAAQQAAQPSDK